jgi:hypothetical protein
MDGEAVLTEAVARFGSEDHNNEIFEDIRFV